MTSLPSAAEEEKKAEKHVSLKLRRVVSERLAQMPCHPLRSSSYAPQIQSIPDRWGLERIGWSLVKQGFCLVPRRVWVRGRQRNLFTASLVISSAKGEENYHRIDIRAQKSYFINQTRLKVLSYIGSTETLAIHIAGRLKYCCCGVYCKALRFTISYACTHHENIWHPGAQNLLVLCCMSTFLAKNTLCGSHLSIFLLC